MGACGFHPPNALQVEVARSGALEAFGSLEEWLKVHPEVGRTEKGIQGYPMAHEENHGKISISVKYVLYYIDFCFVLHMVQRFIHVPLFW